MESPIRVLLAEDHPIVHEGVRDVCAYADNIELVGIAENSQQLTVLLPETQPHILLLDLDIPGNNHLEHISFTRQHCPHTQIIIFSAFCETIHIPQLMRMGIDGYVLKSEGVHVLRDAIRIIAKGDEWYSQQVRTTLSKQITTKSSDLPLSSREIEVLALMGNGYSNEQIANELSLAKQTVANHISCIYQKLGVRSRAKAILWWIESKPKI